MTASMEIEAWSPNADSGLSDVETATVRKAGFKMEKKAQPKICLDLEVRFRDIDSMGHVNNAVFMTYFEEGRKAFLHKVLNIVDPADYPFILARLSCDYLRPIKLGDEVSLQLWIGEIGEKSFTFKYAIVDREDGHKVYGKGQSVMVCFDYRKNRSTRIPAEFQERISPYLDLKVA